MIKYRGNPPFLYGKRGLCKFHPCTYTPFRPRRKVKQIEVNLIEGISGLYHNRLDLYHSRLDFYQK